DSRRLLRLASDGDLLRLHRLRGSDAALVLRLAAHGELRRHGSARHALRRAAGRLCSAIGPDALSGGATRQGRRACDTQHRSRWRRVHRLRHPHCPGPFCRVRRGRHNLCRPLPGERRADLVHRLFGRPRGGKRDGGRCRPYHSL
ncbi:MAG: Uncharacterized MFS-type transporter, partial [uncultured Rubrobacteraceae bacterium]